MKHKTFNLLVAHMNMGTKQRRSYVYCPISLRNVMFLNLLLQKGFIIGYFKSTICQHQICVFLKYYDNKPLLKGIKLCNNYGLAVNVSYKNLIGDTQSKGLMVVSSSLGGLFFSGMFDIFLNVNIKAGGKLIANVDV